MQSQDEIRQEIDEILDQIAIRSSELPDIKCEDASSARTLHAFSSDMVVLLPMLKGLIEEVLVSARGGGADSVQP